MMYLWESKLKRKTFLYVQHINDIWRWQARSDKHCFLFVHTRWTRPHQQFAFYAIVKNWRGTFPLATQKVKHNSINQNLMFYRQHISVRGALSIVIFSEQREMDDAQREKLTKCISNKYDVPRLGSIHAEVFLTVKRKRFWTKKRNFVIVLRILILDSNRLIPSRWTYSLQSFLNRLCNYRRIFLIKRRSFILRIKTRTHRSLSRTERREKKILDWTDIWRNQNEDLTNVETNL